jgi:hypothetical protein
MSDAVRVSQAPKHQGHYHAKGNRTMQSTDMACGERNASKACRLVAWSRYRGTLALHRGTLALHRGCVSEADTCDKTSERPYLLVCAADL